MQGRTMKIYLIEQDVNDAYDTFDKAVVCAVDAADARTIHPESMWGRKEDSWANSDTWASPADVVVTYVGEADAALSRGVICASFNAG